MTITDDMRMALDQIVAFGDDWRSACRAAGLSPKDLYFAMESASADEREEAARQLHAYDAEVSKHVDKWVNASSDLVGVITHDQWMQMFYESSVILPPDFATAGVLKALAAESVPLAVTIATAEDHPNHDPSSGWNFVLGAIAKLKPEQSAALADAASDDAPPGEIRGRAHAISGAAQMRLGDRSAAAAAYQRAIADDPSQRPYYVNCGAALFELGRARDGVSILEDGLRTVGFDADILNNLGCCLKALGLDAAARMRFEEALVADPNHKEARENLMAVGSLARVRFRF